MMKHSFYFIVAIMALLLIAGNSCHKSNDKVAKVVLDSIQSAKEDSLFEAQTKEMMELDKWMDRHADSIDSLKHVWATQAAAAAPTVNIDTDAPAFAKTTMEKYFATLNKGGNCSAAMGSDMSNAALRKLRSLNGGPSNAQDEEGNTVKYVLGSVTDAGGHKFNVSWTRDGQSLSATVTVAQNGPHRLRIDAVN